MRIFETNGRVAFEGDFLLYTQDSCFDSSQAKSLLRKFRIPFIEWKVVPKTKQRILDRLSSRTGEQTRIPAIFNSKGEYLGGLYELYTELAKSNE